MKYMRSLRIESWRKVFLGALLAVTPGGLRAGGVAINPSTGAVAKAQGQEVLIAPSFGAPPSKTFHTPGFFTPLMFRNNLVFGGEHSGAEGAMDVSVVYDLAGQKLFASGYTYTSLAVDGSAVVTDVNPLGDFETAKLEWEQLLGEAGKSQLPLPRKDAFIVRSCKLAPLFRDFDFYARELFALQGGGLLSSAAGVAVGMRFSPSPLVWWPG